MENNVGTFDKLIRLILAFVLFSTYFYLEGNARYISVIGLYPFITAVLTFCPFYKIFKIDSRDSRDMQKGR